MAEGRRAAGLLAALAVLHLFLVFPSQPAALVPATVLRLPLELPLLVALLVAVPSRLLRGAVTAVLVGMLALKALDLATETAFRRPFNPALDAGLVPAAWRLASGTVGWPAALGFAIALAAAFVLAALAVWWATGWIAAFRTRWPVVGAALAVAAGAFVLGSTAGEARLAADHVRAAGAARADLARFTEAAGEDGYARLPAADILPELRGTDVLVLFVESYGRSALDNPLYGPTTRAALGSAPLPRGVAARSGWLTAPMVGGQSWLAHASLLSGLTTSDQGRYRALLASPRRTLLHLAQVAGWETSAAMPAITLAWPEGDWFGYGRILAAADLGYRGKPFNWVTMPDQFTLRTIERRLIEPAPRPPAFVVSALISSHAPWTPVPPLLPWDAIGDGTEFDAAATAGDPPDVVWRDEDRVREQYRRSIDYVLRTVVGFAARHPDALLVVLGDHQPAAFVSGDPDGRDVPVHVIGPADLVAHLDGWGWTPGLVPAADVPARPMADFRDRFLAAFGSG